MIGGASQSRERMENRMMNCLCGGNKLEVLCDVCDVRNNVYIQENKHVPLQQTLEEQRKKRKRCGRH